MLYEQSNSSIEGHLKIWDDVTGEVIVDKRNAINPENLSIAVARSLANSGGTVYEIHFGNGGSVISDNGSITYKKPRVISSAAELYSPTYFKVIDGNDTANNTDVTKNYITTAHNAGEYYTDLIVNAVLGYTEPAVNDNIFNLAGESSQLAYTSEYDGAFVFDEIGLKSKGTNVNTGLLLTHIIFHPVQKSADRLFRIQYTLRIRTELSVVSEV